MSLRRWFVLWFYSWVEAIFEDCLEEIPDKDFVLWDTELYTKD